MVSYLRLNSRIHITNACFCDIIWRSPDGLLTPSLPKKHVKSKRDASKALYA